MQKTVTVEEIMTWGPCPDYPESRVRELFGQRTRVTWRQIARADIPAEDRLWVLLREHWMPAEELHLLACQYAEDALRAERAAGREPDPRSWAAIAAKRKWVAGKLSDAELAAARDAAWAAYADDDALAAHDAARAAASDAALAAHDDALAAARAAAWAAHDAARADSAACVTQLKRCCAVLARLEKEEA